MDNDERDPDLVAENWLEHKRFVQFKRRLYQAFNEPFEEDEHKCIRCGEMRCVDRPDGCEDPLCP